MFLNGIGLDLLNLHTDLLELDLADTPEVVALQRSAPCTEPPYVLHHTEQAFISAQGTAQMFSRCHPSFHCVLSLASLFYDSPVELVKFTQTVFYGLPGNSPAKKVIEVLVGCPIAVFPPHL